MGIDPKTLPPKYQAQIVEKLLQNQREKAAGSPDTGFEKTGKYHNTPDTRNGAEGRAIRFDSKREAARYDELMLLLKAGKIRNLKLQPTFTLQEAFTTPDGERIRARTYRADFSYDRRTLVPVGSAIIWTHVVEDVKGKRTRTYIDKKKELAAMGIKITEIE